MNLILAVFKKEMGTLMKDRTSFITAYRLSTIRDANLNFSNE